MNSSHCIIVGASHAGGQVAASLRQNGWDGKITLIGAEPVLPYHRPPLSKTYLTGEKQIDQILIRPRGFFEQHDIDPLLGNPVAAINRDSKTVVLENGAELSYDKLALTTGSRVRKITIPGVELAGVHYLRNLDDVDRIRQRVGKDKKAVIVGGGYIGLESAAALRKAGMEVTVLEALPRVVQRITIPEVSAFYTRVHEEEGVTILTNTAIESIQGEGEVSSVTCQGGIVLGADLVIIGVGIVPETALAENAGLAIDNGILVDEYARTSDHDIVAAGDCTCHHNPIYDRYVRLESVQNAVDQAKVAATTLCGRLEAYNALPWFWSDQYDIKLQIAGLSQGFDQVVIRGSIDSHSKSSYSTDFHPKGSHLTGPYPTGSHPTGSHPTGPHPTDPHPQGSYLKEKRRSFAVFYLREGKLLAVDAINRPKEFMFGKRALLNPISPDPAKLADESFDLHALLK